MFLRQWILKLLKSLCMITFIAVFRFGLSSTRMAMASRRVSSSGDGQGSAAYDSHGEAEASWRWKGGSFCSLHLPDGTQHKEKGWQSWFATREFLSREKDLFIYLLSIVLWGYLDTGTRTWRIVKSSALKIFKLNRPGTWTTCSRWPCFKQGFGLDSLHGSLSTWAILQFYEYLLIYPRVPVLIILHWCSPNLQQCKSSWMNCCMSG